MLRIECQKLDWMRGFRHGQCECAAELMGVLNRAFAQSDVFSHMFLAEKVPNRQTFCLFTNLWQSNGNLRHCFNILGRFDWVRVVLPDVPIWSRGDLRCNKRIKGEQKVGSIVLGQRDKDCISRDYETNSDSKGCSLVDNLWEVNTGRKSS